MKYERESNEQNALDDHNVCGDKCDSIVNCFKQVHSARNPPSKKRNLIIINNQNKKIFPDDFFDKSVKTNKTTSENCGIDNSDVGDNGKLGNINNSQITHRRNSEITAPSEATIKFARNSTINHQIFSHYSQKNLQNYDNAITSLKKKPLSAIPTSILSAKSNPVKLTLISEYSKKGKSRCHLDNLDLIFDSIPEEDEEKNKTDFFNVTNKSNNFFIEENSQQSFLRVSLKKTGVVGNKEINQYNQMNQLNMSKRFSNFNIDNFEENYNNNLNGNINRKEENVQTLSENFRPHSSESNNNEVSTSGSYKIIPRVNLKVNVDVNNNKYNSSNPNTNSNKNTPCIETNTGEDYFMKTACFKEDFNKTTTKFKIIHNENEDKMWKTPSNRRVKMENTKKFFEYPVSTDPSGIPNTVQNTLQNTVRNVNNTKIHNNVKNQDSNKKEKTSMPRKESFKYFNQKLKSEEKSINTQVQKLLSPKQQNQNRERNPFSTLPVLLPPLTTRTQPQKIQLELNNIFHVAQNFKEDPEINNKMNNLIQNIEEIKNVIRRRNSSKRTTLTSAPAQAQGNKTPTHITAENNKNEKQLSSTNSTISIAKIKREISSNKKTLKLIDMASRKKIISELNAKR